MATRYRSRAFLQPLLVTIVGVTLLPGIFIAWRYLFVPPSEPCTATWCGYGIGQAIILGVALLAVWCTGMLIAGAAVAWQTRDPKLAFRAILVALASLALLVTIVATTSSPTSESLLDIVSIFLATGITFMIPNLLGFGVGRLGRPRPEDASKAPGSE